MLQQQLRGVECHTVRIGSHGDVYCITHSCYKLDCLECGKLFHTARPHTRTCSNACRQRAYRRRKAEQNQESYS